MRWSEEAFEADEEDGEKVEFTPFLIGSTSYLRTDEGESWVMASDGTRGAWAGVYNVLTGVMDTKAENPFEE